MLWLAFAVVTLQFHNCVGMPQFDFGEYDYADQFPNPNKFTEVAPFATNKATERPGRPVTPPMRPTQPVTTRPSPPVTTRPPPPVTTRPSPPVTTRPPPPVTTRPSPPVAMRPSRPVPARPPTAGRPPSYSQCVEECVSSTHYHPVCGSDNKTYNNMSTLRCAQFCGRDVEFSRHGPCCIPWESWK